MLEFGHDQCFHQKIHFGLIVCWMFRQSFYCHSDFFAVLFGRVHQISLIHFTKCTLAKCSGCGKTNKIQWKWQKEAHWIRKENIQSKGIGSDEREEKRKRSNHLYCWSLVSHRIDHQHYKDDNKARSFAMERILQSWDFLPTERCLCPGSSRTKIEWNA